MAIISGMEAAVVDDVKPFEMPIDDMAKGIIARQQRADKNKELYGIGASALNFKVRDREEDYAAKQGIIDKYNQGIASLAESVGGDWSQLDNSQIQSLAMKTAADPLVSHLIEAKDNADIARAKIQNLEEQGGFALKFGADPYTQSLYNEDGSFRNLRKYSIQNKLDHETAADAYFDHITLDKLDEIVWAYRNDMGLEKKFGDGYPVSDNVTEAQKQNTYYDFYQRDWMKVQSNEPKILELINNSVDSFIASKAGMQYHAQMRDFYLKKGLTPEQAEVEARKAVVVLLNNAGRKRVQELREVTSDRFFQNYPMQGGGGGDRSGPAGKGAGGKTDPPVIVDPIRPDHTFTQEGLMAGGSLGDVANGMLSEHYSLQALDKNFSVSEIKNVRAVGESVTLVPGSTNTVLDANGKPVMTNTKSTVGVAYGAFQNSFGDVTNNYGTNPAAIRIGGDTRSLGIIPNYARLGYLKEYSDQTSDKVKAYGRACYEKADLLSYYTQQIKTSYANSGRNINDPQELALIRSEAERLTTQFLGGEGGDVSAMYKSTYNDDLGYSTYSVRDEYSGMVAILDKQIKDLSAKGADQIPDVDKLKPEDLGKYTKEDFELSIAISKKANLNAKIKESDEKIRLMNTRPENLTIEELSDPETMRVVKEFERARVQSLSLRHLAGQYKAFEQDLAAQCNMDENMYAMYVDPKRMTAGTKEEVYKVKNAKLDAMLHACSNNSGYYSTGWLSEVVDVIAKRSKADAEQFQNEMLSYLEGLRNGNSDLNYDFVKNNKILSKYNVTKAYGGSAGRSAGKTFPKIETTINFLKDSYGIPDDQNPGKYKGYKGNFTQMGEKYAASLATKLKETKGVHPNYIDFVNKSEKMNKEFEFRTTGFMVNANGNEKEKDLYSRLEMTVFSKIDAVVDGASQNMQEDEKITVVHWGSSASDKDKAAGAIESTINLDGDLVDKILEGYRGAAGNNDKKNATLGDILKDKSYSNISSIVADFGHSPPFRAIVNTKYLSNGNLIDIRLEVPFSENHHEILQNYGVTAPLLQYGYDIARDYKATGNFRFTLAVPGTENSARPIERNYYRLPYEFRTPSGEVHPIGTIVTFDVDDENTPLDKKLNDLAGTNSIRFFNNEELAASGFHEEMAKPDAKLAMILTKVDAVNEVYNNYVKKNAGKLTPAQLQQGLKMVINGTFGENVYESINGGKAIDANSFNKVKIEQQQKRGKQYMDANPHPSDKHNPFTDKNSQVQITTNVKESNTNLTIRNKTSNAVMTEQDFKAMSDEDMASFYANKNLENAGADMDRVSESIKKGEYQKVDGKRFLKSPEIVPLTKIAGDPVKTTSGRTGYEYGVIPVSQKMKGVKDPYLFLAGANPNLDKKLISGLQDLTNHIAPDYLGGHLEISSGQRSIEENLDSYKQDYYKLTPSRHLTGRAIDISTIAAAKNANDVSGPGFRLLDFAHTDKGKQWLEKNKLRLLYHKVNGSEWHIHLEYSEEPYSNGTRLNNEDKQYTPSITK